MKYIVIFIILLILELFYFRLAEHFNIIDRPNERSSHSSVTLRGGGLVFYFGAAIYFVLSGLEYPWFFLGLTLITAISFMDDILTLSNKIRLVIHFFAVLLMSFQLNLFEMSWYFVPISFVLIVGIINAYNFMDGINGITACYSLSVGILLMIVNYDIQFIPQDFLIYPLLGVLVFTFFNFRTNAKCFAGDVGSVAVVYILLFALGRLILSTGNFIYILFLVVYGIDTIWTIIRRLYYGENIFKAHRSHLYQLLGNEVGINKLLIALLYGTIQFLIGYLVIGFASEKLKTQIILSFTIIIVLSVLYIVSKRIVMKKYVKSRQ